MTYSGIELGKHETALLAEWDRRRRREVTIRDIAASVGSKAAAATAAALVRKGVLDRIGRGIYVVRPLRAFGRHWTLSALVAVELLLRGVPHYVGGLAAFTVHRLSRQVYGSTVDAYVVQYRPPRQLANARVVFHRLPTGRFDFGLTAVSVEGTEVTLSDPPRTLLDALDYPDALGGLSAAVPLVAAALGRVDCRQLVEYALRGSPSSTCQRLGLLLERKGVPVAALEPLLEHVKASRSVPAMVPGAPRVGRVNPRWRIVENDDRVAPAAGESSDGTDAAPLEPTP